MYYGMNKIRPVYVSEKEYDMFCSVMEQISNGKEDDNGNFISMLTLNNEEFNALMEFATKLTK